MSSQPQNFSGEEAIRKAKDLAKDNPDSSRSVIDKLEDMIDAKTGGKYSSMVDKGGDFLERQLGVPAQTETRDEAPSATPEGADAATAEKPSSENATPPATSQQAEPENGPSTQTS